MWLEIKCTSSRIIIIIIYYGRIIIISYYYLLDYYEVGLGLELSLALAPLLLVVCL